MASPVWGKLDRLAFLATLSTETRKEIYTAIGKRVLKRNKGKFKSSPIDFGDSAFSHSDLWKAAVAGEVVPVLDIQLNKVQQRVLAEHKKYINKLSLLNREMQKHSPEKMAKLLCTKLTRKEFLLLWMFLEQDLGRATALCSECSKLAANIIVKEKV